MRYAIDGRITNINVMLTKLGLAESTDMSIFDGEKEQKEEKCHILKKLPPQTLLEKETKEIIKSLDPIKIHKTTPDGSVLCFVTNAVSPSEIWVQDIVDSDSCYDV
jgi:hypothetical protein